MRLGSARSCVRIDNERMIAIFGRGTQAPDDAALARTLGKTKRVWDAILDHIDRLPNGPVREWKFYGRKYGWQMKVTDRKRALMYLVPHDGSFLAAFALNDKAVAALRSQNIPESLMRDITTGKSYPEGRPARVEVTTSSDLMVVKKLLEIKRLQ